MHQQSAPQPHRTAPIPSTKRPMTAKSTYRPTRDLTTRRNIVCAFQGALRYLSEYAAREALAGRRPKEDGRARGLELDLSRRRSRFGGCSGLVSSLSGGICSAGGVHHLPDELFEDVFKCNQAADLAVLVDQAGEV